MRMTDDDVTDDDDAANDDDTDIKYDDGDTQNNDMLFVTRVVVK